MNFEMIGKLSLPKETEKFKAWKEQEFSSGWVKRTLNVNAICGANRHLLTIDSGSFKDGHGKVYTRAKSTVGSDGKRKQGENLEVEFKNRLKKDILEKVDESRKFVIDLEKPKRRYALSKLVEKKKDGETISEDDLKEVDVSSIDDLEKAYEESCKKKHEYISEWDFAETVKKVATSDKYKDKLFRIRGRGIYSFWDNKVYESYVPQRIYLADDSETPSSTATIKVLFDNESLDDSMLDEMNVYYLNGYTMEYESNYKKTLPFPITITINNDDSSDLAVKKTKRIVSKFNVPKGEVKEYGVFVNMINGTQQVEITEDMLTDEQKEDLECGLITMDDIRADFGGSVAGNWIKEYQFVKPSKGYTNGAQETAYTSDDLIINIDDELDEDDEAFDEI